MHKKHQLMVLTIVLVAVSVVVFVDLLNSLQSHCVQRRKPAGDNLE